MPVTGPEARYERRLPWVGTGAHAGRRHMSNVRPLWRRAFDRAERGIGRPLENFVGTRAFTDLLALTFRAQGAVYGVFQGQTRAVLHFWNMPARTDVSRLQRQVGVLNAQVRELVARLEEQERRQREPEHAATSGPARP